jgi:hypothetical protein
VLAAAAGLVWLALAASMPSATQAATGDGRICRIEGPTTIQAGKTALYAWRVQDNREDVGARDQFTLDLDNVGGDSSITGIAREDLSDGEGGFERSDLKTLGPTNFLRNADVATPADIESDLRSYLKSRYGYTLSVNPCGAAPSAIITACLKDGLCGEFRASTSQRSAWSNAVTKAMAGGETSCATIGDKGDSALIGAGYGDPAGRGQIETYWNNVCDSTTPGHSVGPIMDSAGFALVTCTRSGSFQLSIVDQEGTRDTGSIKVTCRK